MSDIGTVTRGDDNTSRRGPRLRKTKDWLKTLSGQEISAETIILVMRFGPLRRWRNQRVILPVKLEYGVDCFIRNLCIVSEASALRPQSLERFVY
jgi:hypothetical protein